MSMYTVAFLRASFTMYDSEIHNGKHLRHLADALIQRDLQG